MFQRGRGYFRSYGIFARGRKKGKTNAIVEKSRVRTLLPPHYIKVHTRVRRESAAKSQRKRERKRAQGNPTRPSDMIAGKEKWKSETGVRER